MTRKSERALPPLCYFPSSSSSSCSQETKREEVVEERKKEQIQALLKLLVQIRRPMSPFTCIHEYIFSPRKARDQDIFLTHALSFSSCTRKKIFLVAFLSTTSYYYTTAFLQEHHHDDDQIESYAQMAKTCVPFHKGHVLLLPKHLLSILFNGHLERDDEYDQTRALIPHHTLFTIIAGWTEQLFYLCILPCSSPVIEKWLSLLLCSGMWRHVVLCCMKLGYGKAL